MSFHGPFNLQGAALKLYESSAKNAPICDYHCHLSPREIYEDTAFTNVGQAMLGGDHYKWRAMRYSGLPENIITGDADWFSKFEAWLRTCEQLAGSPLQVWTREELQTYFGVEKEACLANAKVIYEHCNKVIQESALSPRKIMAAMNVRAVCTTDDPLDDLQYHKLLAEDKTMSCKVLPTFRPDAVMKIQSESFVPYIARLSSEVGFSVNSFSRLLDALEKRIEYFYLHGCIFSDHSLESMRFPNAGTADVEDIFAAACTGSCVSCQDAEKYRFQLLCELGRMYATKGIAMQMHIGALRNVNEKMHSVLGVDAGYDVSNDFRVAEYVATLLNAMESCGNLPRVLLYTLNSKDYQTLAALCPSFTQPGIPGKVQLGPAWWHCDTGDGMLEQISCAGSFGLLRASWGMLTDSRSFLSYTRHDYFRRILCMYLGTLKDNKTYQGGIETLMGIVEDISFNNVARFANCL